MNITWFSTINWNFLNSCPTWFYHSFSYIIRSLYVSHFYDPKQLVAIYMREYVGEFLCFHLSNTIDIFWFKYFYQMHEIKDNIKLGKNECSNYTNSRDNGNTRMSTFFERKVYYDLRTYRNIYSIKTLSFMNIFLINSFVNN